MVFVGPPISWSDISVSNSWSPHPFLNTSLIFFPWDTTFSSVFSWFSSFLFLFSALDPLHLPELYMLELLRAWVLELLSFHTVVWITSSVKSLKHNRFTVNSQSFIFGPDHFTEIQILKFLTFPFESQALIWNLTSSKPKCWFPLNLLLLHLEQLPGLICSSPDLQHHAL